MSREPAAVDADLVAQDALANQLLRQRPVSGADLACPLRELRRHSLLGELLDPVQLGFPLLLVGNGQGLSQRLRDLGAHRGEDVVLVVEEDRKLDRRLCGDLGELGLRAAQLGDERLGRLQPRGDDLLGRPSRPIRDELQAFSVASASTIMIATSPESSTRPATTMSNVARATSEWVGKATHWPSMRATRVPPIGPVNGSPDSWVDAEAALMASTS